MNGTVDRFRTTKASVDVFFFCLFRYKSFAVCLKYLYFSETFAVRMAEIGNCVNFLNNHNNQMLDAQEYVYHWSLANDRITVYHLDFNDSKFMFKVKAFGLWINN